MDLQRRKKAAENLNRRAILNAIAETYVITAAPDTYKPEDAAAVCTPGVAVAALSFHSMHDQGTVGVRTECSAVAIQLSCISMHMGAHLRCQMVKYLCIQGTAPDSAGSIASKTPMPLSTPSLPPSTMSTPTFDSPLDTEEEEPHEGVGAQLRLS